MGSTVHKRYCVECRYMCPILTQQLKEFSIFIIERIPVTNNLYKAAEKCLYNVAEKEGNYNCYCFGIINNTSKYFHNN